MQSLDEGLSNRFVVLLTFGVVALSAGYAALVLYSASWPEAVALRQFYHWAPRAYTVAEFSGVRPALAALAAVTIVVGNVGALGQSSLKRMLAYSSVAQAGYMLAGVVVATQLGVRATVLYLVTYLLMNLAAFAVIVARERETEFGDDIDSLAGLGAERPVLAWSMTIAMLSLAGIPATAGFIGKVYLIQAAVDGQYAWLAVVIVLGSAVSLAYYLRVLAAIWMRDAPSLGKLVAPAMAGGSQELPVVPAPARGRHPEVAVVAILGAAGSLFFGIIPQPLFDLVHGAGSALTGLL